MTGAVSIERQETTSRRRQNYCSRYCSRSAKDASGSLSFGWTETSCKWTKLHVFCRRHCHRRLRRRFAVLSPRFVSLNTVKREGRISFHKVPAQMKAATVCLLRRMSGKMFLFFIYTRTHTEDGDNQHTIIVHRVSIVIFSIDLMMLCRRRRLEGTSSRTCRILNNISTMYDILWILTMRISDTSEQIDVSVFFLDFERRAKIVDT